MNNRSYYAVIPSYILQDKNINPNSKLLYADITALCNEKGFCWAKNEYFSERYAVSVRTIQNYLKELQEAGYIKIVLTKKNQVRHIYIQHKQVELEEEYDYEDYNFDTGVKKIAPDGRKNFQGTGEKNCTQNNTYNITNNNTSEVGMQNKLQSHQPSPHLKLDFENINSIASYGDWDLETFKACVLNWVIKMSGQAVSGLRQVLKYYELENLERNFERRLNNCGWAIVFAVDDAYKSDVRFRKKDFVSFLNIYLTEYGKLSSKRENEGEDSRIRMDYYKG